MNKEDSEGDIAGAIIFPKLVYTIVTGTITIYVTYDVGKRVKKVYKKIKKKIKQSKSKKENTKSKKKKKTSKQSGKERADDPPSWAKNEEYDKSKTAAQNAERVLNKKYGKNNWKKITNSEYSKIKKWLQRSKGYK